MTHSSPTSAHSPSLAQPSTSNPSTTPVSSSHSHSNSSQHDPASPPHFTASSTDSTVGAYQSQPSATGRSSTVLDTLDTSMNGNHHPLAQSFRTTGAAFHSPFSTTFSPPPGSSSFNLALQSRQQAQSFRSDHLSVSSSSFHSHSHFPASPPNYPTKADVFGTSQPMDALGRYDYEAFATHDALHGQQQPPLVLKGSQVFNPAGGFSLGGVAGSSALQPQVSKLTGASSQGSYNSASVNGALPYLNGVAQSQQGPPPPLMQGPPLPSMNGILPPFTAPQHTHGHGQHPMLHTPGPGPGVQVSSQGQSQQPSQQQQQQGQQPQAGRIDQSQEEISTIFVVGFPDDMQEREFQNMFTFSVGFEAATLKIPNKDSSAYGPASGINRQGYGHGSAGPYSGSQDPYNLVTVNSGGVVVDGPQGTSSSWQQGSDYAATAGDGTHGQTPAMPPRKQIIGFAKFRTRQEALEARDLLQGRRVDIDKGAVLKAEMAKKNLHTKRGVGPLGLPVGLMGVAGSNANPVASEMLAGMPGLNGYPAVVTAAVSGVESVNAPIQGPDSLSVRDRQMGALGAMGLVGPTTATRRQEEDKDRRPFRAEEDEQRRKKEQQERNNKLRMSNAQVYDAFHSVPADHQLRRGSSAVNGSVAATSGTGPLSPSAGFGDSGTAFPGFGFNTNGGPSSNTFQLASNGSVMVGHGFQNHHPFSNSSEVLSNASHWGPPGKPAPFGGEGQKFPPPPARPSSAQSSPPSSFDAPYIPPPSANTNRGGYYGGGGSSDSSAFSPSEFSTPLPPIGPRPPPRGQSPLNNGEMQPFGGGGGFQAGLSSSLPRSGASSVTGGSQSSSLDEQFSRTLMVSTHQGMTSPQLPSPGSGGSSSNTRQGNASDQNPPINTLYVGNLSNSPMPPGIAPNYLEDALKNLFSQCKGYRKLCFRQKSNGPMCFVEFEDVQHATKALNELYGNQLNGLVKGGIRLSFSKNPLGVRPSPAGSIANPPSSRRDGREGWNGPIQPPGQPNMNYSSIHDAFHTRPLQPQQGQQQQQPGLALDLGAGRPGRLVDVNEMSSPPTAASAGFPSYNVSSPPSRFFSPPPSQVAFGGATTAGSSNGFSSSRFGPNSPFVSEDEQRLRYREVPPHSFASSPGLENTTRVG